MKAKPILVLAIICLMTLAWGALEARTTSPGLECLSFCSIAYCPQGTTCGPTPSGGCGCNPDGIIIVEAGS